MSRSYTLSPKKKKKKSAPSYKDSRNQQSAQDYANSLLDSFQQRQEQTLSSAIKQTPKAIAATAAAMEKADRTSRTNRIGFLEEFGQRARAAAFKANPELRSALDRYNSGTTDAADALGDAATGRSALLASLNEDALAAGPSAISRALEQNALDELSLGGRLSADEARLVDQTSRAAFADRGLVRSNPAIVAEVMNRDAAQRARMRERQGFAGSVNQQLLGEQAQNRDFGTNVEQLNRADAAQRAGFQTQRAGLLSNAVTINQAIDPAQQILAGPTNAGGATQSGLSLLNMSQSTPTMLTGLQDQAYGAFLNRDESRYNAALNAATAQDAANKQLAAARSAGKSAMIGSGIQAVGSLGGAAIGAAGLVIF
jgi:hypothetical protein